MDARNHFTDKLDKSSYVIAISFILLMVGLSVLLQHSEIILPEVAAMAIAMWVYREPGWIRRPFDILIAPTATAAFGIVMNPFKIPYPIKVILTLIIIMLFMRFICSNLAPAIATGLLPLATHTEEWSFVFIVCLFMLILTAGVVIFQLNKHLVKKSIIQYKYMVIFLIISLCWLSICWGFGYEQIAVIPPVFVVVYESLQKTVYSGKMALKQGVTLTISAAFGVFIFMQFESQVLATLIDMILAVMISRLFRARIPALFAIPLLTFVFPEENIWTLPIATFFACVFMFSFILLYKNREKRTSLWRKPVSIRNSMTP